MMRINKILSTAGIASRRAADELIQQGRVEVNGRVVNVLGAQADPVSDDIRVDGRRLKNASPERRYLLVYKPRGVVSTRSDPERRQTIIELVAKRGITGYLYPVGRLDYDSEGLIILTNDGDFAERVTHPRYELERTYEVEVEGAPDDRDMERLRRGIVIDGRRTKPADVRVLRPVQGRHGVRTVIEITLHEGRNRQVRYMCDAIAHPVNRLRRTRIGPVTDRRLKPGDVRDLTPAEIRALTSDPASPARRPRPARSGPGATSPRAERPNRRPRGTRGG